MRPLLHLKDREAAGYTLKTREAASYTFRTVRPLLHLKAVRLCPSREAVSRPREAVSLVLGGARSTLRTAGPEKDKERAELGTPFEPGLEINL